MNSNDSLPRKISNLPILYLRKNRSDDPTDFKDFIVKRNNIKMWLEFLVEHNPLYRNQSINDDLLNELPENGSVLNSLNIQDEEETLTNEENFPMNLMRIVNRKWDRNREEPQAILVQYVRIF